MARPDIVRGTYINILMGDGEDPEVFTPICGLTTRTFTHQINTSDAFVRDCADPEDIPARELTPTGEQWDLAGNGWLNRADLEDVDAATGQIKSFRFEIGEPAADQVYGGYWFGQAMITQMQITGTDEDFAQIDLTIASHGEWAFQTVS